MKLEEENESEITRRIREIAELLAAKKPPLEKVEVAEGAYILNSPRV